MRHKVQQRSSVHRSGGWHLSLHQGITGMASQYFSHGQLLILDHKTIFSISVFLVIGFLLMLNHHSGARGKIVTKLVLLAYLLLTLGYPGVKLVTNIILI